MTVVTSDPLASAVLTQVRELVGARMRLTIDRLPGPTRALVARHFGWHRRDCVATTDIGKGVRAALVMLAAEAVGGTSEQALPAAVAVELVHNASLLHDDIIDRDRQRRGMLALWAAEGVPAAILAGDVLFFAAIQVLVETPGANRLLPVLLDSVQTLINGEYLDTIDPLRIAGGDIDESALVSVAAAKTGDLMACACALGALAADAVRNRVDHLMRFGRHLGVAFQCIDDMLNLWGEESVTGKPARSDLRERRVTIPVAIAIATGGPQATALRALYCGDGPLGDDECAYAIDLIERTGAKTSTLELARSHINEALLCLQRAKPLSTPASQLAAVASSVVRGL